MLAHVVCECWHALVYDVLALGYRIEDMFTTLGLAEMIAIAVAAPPGSSVRYFLDGGWTRTDQLLANMAEQQAGVATLSRPYPRPGIEARPPPDPAVNAKFFPAEAMTWEEAERRDKERYARAAAGTLKPKGRTRVKTYTGGGT
jgi:hypothetical protein